jgi:lysophospholipase L1-like esterase
MPRRSSPAPTPASTKVPHLTATRFVAFGDGITEGLVQACPASAADPSDAAADGPLSRSPAVMPPQARATPSPTAYPEKLQQMLADRYPQQPATVVNEGLGGEEIAAAAERLSGVLTLNSLQVLLLQHGIQTLHVKHTAGIPEVVDGLRRMIQEARSRRILVLAATLLPERPGGCRAYDYAEGLDDIIAANVEIRRMIGTEGAVLVDLYEAFNGETSILIGEDGLHPSAAGYQKIAEAFFAGIKRHLED